MDLTRIEPIARRILAELYPFCDQIAVVGSIRRRRPNCNDIDIAAQVKPNQHVALRHRVLQNTRAIRAGDDLMSVRLKTGLQLDIFFADPPVAELLDKRPGNWGAILLTRTGSKEHNRFICMTAKRLGLHYNPQYGVFGRCPRTGREGTCLAAATEEEIFQVLKLEYVPPEKRER